MPKCNARHRKRYKNLVFPKIWHFVAFPKMWQVSSHMLHLHWIMELVASPIFKLLESWSLQMAVLLMDVSTQTKKRVRSPSVFITLGTYFIQYLIALIEYFFYQCIKLQKSIHFDKFYKFSALLFSVQMKKSINRW